MNSLNLIAQIIIIKASDGGASYKQKWSDDPVPTKEGALNLQKIPLDGVNVTGGLNGVTSKKIFEYTSGHSDGINVSGGLCGITINTIEL